MWIENSVFSYSACTYSISVGCYAVQFFFIPIIYSPPPRRVFDDDVTRLGDGGGGALTILFDLHPPRLVPAYTQTHITSSCMYLLYIYIYAYTKYYYNRVSAVFVLSYTHALLDFKLLVLYGRAYYCYSVHSTAAFVGRSFGSARSRRRCEINNNILIAT